MVRHSEECFLGTTPTGWHWKLGKGEEGKGPATLPREISLSWLAETTSGCWEAEIKLRETLAFWGPR